MVTLSRVVFATLFVLMPMTATADALPRNQALYVTMRDDVRIAVDVWLPDGLDHGEKVPVLMHATRYWRAMQSMAPGIENENRYEEAERANQAGYALVLVDARGSGASFGSRPYERSVEEATDYGEIVNWIVEQAWSDGKVGAYGISYAGNTAELLLINRHPAVKAVAPLFNDFDNYSHLAFPGGAMEAGPLEAWSRRNVLRDRNDLCGYRELAGDDCDELLSRWAGPKRVDADTDGSLLAAAVEDHASNVDYYQAGLRYEFRDDPWTDDKGDGGVIDAGRKGSPSGYLAAIEASNVPMFIRAGWQDAGTVNGTLARYNTIGNPQQVTIGPWDHGARNDADPFHPADAPVSPDEDAQWVEMLEFFDYYLKADGGPRPSSIRYYTLGADRWSTTESWPPSGFAPTAWYLDESGGLGTERPTTDNAGARYAVDFDATTGRHNRWFTNNGGGGDVVYGDRRSADERLLTFTSEPFDADTEITGHPVITLFVESTHDDGLFIAYLEDVAPNGTVTYITEGQLRALVRDTSDGDADYWRFGPQRSERRADAMPLVPGEVAELEFELWATSVLIRKGHSLRVAIAGADRDTFLRYPRDGGEPVITIHSNAEYSSRIELPMKTVGR